MLRLIRQWLKTYNQKGFSLMEALVATAIMGIGFSGVYTLVMLSETQMRKSIAKEKLQMQANQILEVIETDISNIDNYASDLTTCVAPGSGVTTKSVVRPYEWCSRLEGELGTAITNETRSINITTLSDGRKVVHIMLEAVNDTVQVVMKRVYDPS